MTWHQSATNNDDDAIQDDDDKTGGDENQEENDMTSISLGMMSLISRSMMTSKLSMTMTANVKSATKITFTNLMIMKIKKRFDCFPNKLWLLCFSLSESTWGLWLWWHECTGKNYDTDTGYDNDCDVGFDYGEINALMKF